MPSIKVLAPNGLVMDVTDPSQEASFARAGVLGWKLVPETTTPDAGAGSPEPAPVAGPVRRKRGRPRKARIR